MWLVSVPAGAALAAAVEGFVPSVLFALAPIVGTIVFALGAREAPDFPAVAHAVRAMVGVTGGFLAVTIPFTVREIARSADAAARAAELIGARPEDVYGALAWRWALMGLAIPVGAGVLAIARRRRRSEGRGPHTG